MVLDPPQAPDGPPLCGVEVSPREASFPDGVVREADETPPDVGAHDRGSPVLVASGHGQLLRLRAEPAPVGHRPVGAAAIGAPTLGSCSRRRAEPVTGYEAVGMWRSMPSSGRAA